MTTFQTTSTASSALERSTMLIPSPMSFQCPRLSILPAWSRAAGIRASSAAETTNVAALIQ
jgi:hypothetical protein